MENKYKSAVYRTAEMILEFLNEGTSRSFLDEKAETKNWKKDQMGECVYYYIKTDVDTAWDKNFIFWDFHNHPRDFYGENEFRYFTFGAFHSDDNILFKRKIDFDMAYIELENYLIEKWGVPYKEGQSKSENIPLAYSFWKNGEWFIGIQQTYNDPQYPIITQIIFTKASHIPVDIKMIYPNE